MLINRRVVKLWFTHITNSMLFIKNNGVDPDVQTGNYLQDILRKQDAKDCV